MAGKIVLEEDYKNTVMNMVMGEAPSFDEIMTDLENLNRHINHM